MVRMAQTLPAAAVTSPPTTRMRRPAALDAGVPAANIHLERFSR